MNRRSFFSRFSAAAALAAVPSAMNAEQSSIRRALQGGMPQCPECLCTLAVTAPRGPDALRAWAAQETHVLHCGRCNLDVLWRTLL